MAEEKATEPFLTLIHIEVEGQEQLSSFRKRMFEYYFRLRLKYQLPVFSIGLFLHVGLEGMGWDSYEEHYLEDRVLHFQYRYIGLPALSAEEYFQKENVLAKALIALMAMPKERRLEIGKAAWRSLLQCPENIYRKYLLCDCVAAYLPKNDQERKLFEQALLSESDPGVRTMTTTLFEKIRQEGIEKGIEKGQREMLVLQLKTRFADLSPDIIQQIESAPVEEIQRWLLAIVQEKNLDEMGLHGDQGCDG